MTSDMTSHARNYSLTNRNILQQDHSIVVFPGAFVMRGCDARGSHRMNRLTDRPMYSIIIVVVLLCPQHVTPVLATNSRSWSQATQLWPPYSMSAWGRSFRLGLAECRGNSHALGQARHPMTTTMMMMMSSGAIPNTPLQNSELQWDVSCK